MPVQFHCRFCNQLLSVGGRKAGTRVPCPVCGGVQTLLHLPPGVVDDSDDPVSAVEDEAPELDLPLEEAPSSSPVARNLLAGFGIGLVLALLGAGGFAIYLLIDRAAEVHGPGQQPSPSRNQVASLPKKAAPVAVKPNPVQVPQLPKEPQAKPVPEPAPIKKAPPEANPPAIKPKAPAKVEVQEPPPVKKVPPKVEVPEPPPIKPRRAPKVEPQEPPPIKPRNPPKVEVPEPPPIKPKSPPKVEVPERPPVKAKDPPKVEKPAPMPMKPRDEPAPPKGKDKPAPPEIVEKKQPSAATQAAQLCTALIDAAPDAQEEILDGYRTGKGDIYDMALARAIPDLPRDLQRKGRDALFERLAGLPMKDLRSRLQDECRELRYAAILVCKEKRLRVLVPDLIERLADSDERVIWNTRRALKAITGQDCGPQPGASAAERAQIVAFWHRWWKRYGQK